MEGSICFMRPYRYAVLWRFLYPQQPAGKHLRHPCIVPPVAGSRLHRAKFSAARSPLHTYDKYEFWMDEPFAILNVLSGSGYRFAAAVFLMDFAPEMLLFLFKNRKNSSLYP